MKNTAKVILLTGVSRGLGRALTGKFIALGHTVLGCARSTGEIESLRQEFGETHSFSVVDVTSDSQVKSWQNTLERHYWTPDYLINNAALINHSAPLWTIGAEEFSMVIDVNIKGVANVIRHFLPAMLRRGSGVVVNFSSGWGRSVDAEVAPYCATKFAIEGLTQALALELPPGLAAIPLNPGIINTDMLRSCFGGAAGSYPSPQEWAERAAPFILGLGPEQNGRPVSVG